MLELNKVRYAYPEQASPYRFSLRVAPGEIAAVTGVSGSGKSTLLDLVAGFLTPSDGAISLDGQSLLSLGPEARPVSILFQDDNLFDHLGVAANLELGLPPNTPRSDRAARIETALSEVGMPGFGDRPALKLSGGEKQRVALARTLLRGKPVLLLDEPFANLDSKTATSMRRLVRRLTDAHGWCVVIVSHLPEDAAELADRHYSLADWSLSEVSDSADEVAVPPAPSAAAAD